ncbi:hypothetical protein [Brucella endophytica]|uniref:hypothetical protein n=1 Tax=Brucella endophytica TaxID=1963359 RepID=UPI001AEED175|nr:hypothetical protein [Brucella endophytica]
MRLRWRILCDTPVYGGLFTSDQVLEDPGRPKLFDQWFDFLFLGRDGRMIWNAEIITARRAFWDAVSDIAWERAMALMSEEERAEEFRTEFEPVYHRGQKYYQVKPREPRRYEQFDGLTFREYEERLREQIIKTEPPSVRESYRLDRDYRYGIGLYIVADAEVIDRAVVEGAITRFQKLGETAWENEQPVARDRLPFETEDMALAALKANGLVE